MNKIYIKVCGMRDPQNIKDLLELDIDFMGMIFYPKSPRYVDKTECQEKICRENGTKSVGVFVNEDVDIITEKIKHYGLDLIQLHGSESYEDCIRLNELVPVIKAFSIKDCDDMEKVNKFGSFKGYYLFDTKTPNHGGSGKKFDWSVLDTYTGGMPFFLSGGISIEDVDQIKKIQHPKFAGIDLNSKFEVAPGLKNIDLLETFIKKIRS